MKSTTKGQNSIRKSDLIRKLYNASRTHLPTTPAGLQITAVGCHRDSCKTRPCQHGMLETAESWKRSFIVQTPPHSCLTYTVPATLALGVFVTHGALRKACPALTCHFWRVALFELQKHTVWPVSALSSCLSGAWRNKCIGHIAFGNLEIRMYSELSLETANACSTWSKSVTV